MSVASARIAIILQEYMTTVVPLAHAILHPFVITGDLEAIVSGGITVPLSPASLRRSVLALRTSLVTEVIVFHSSAFQ